MEAKEWKQPEPESGSGPTDEELFCDYLSARLQQALQALNETRDMLVANPGDYGRAMEVMRKVYELRDLKKQLEHQRGRVNAAREAAGLAPIAENELAPIATPTEEFRATQAEQADKIMATLKAQPQTCPSCQALLAADATQCGCGYRRPRADAGALLDSTAPTANTPPFTAR